MPRTDDVQERTKVILQAVTDLREGGKLWDALCGIQSLETNYVTAYANYVEILSKLGMPRSMPRRWKRGTGVAYDRQKILDDIQECWRELPTFHKTFDNDLLYPIPAGLSENSDKNESPAVAEYRKKVIEQVWFLSRLISDTSESVKTLAERRLKVKLGPCRIVRRRSDTHGYRPVLNLFRLTPTRLDVVLIQLLGVSRLRRHGAPERGAVVEVCGGGSLLCRI
jgi:hypothetical protein